MEVIGNMESKMLMLERNSMCVCSTYIIGTRVGHGRPALRTGDGGLLIHTQIISVNDIGTVSCNYVYVCCVMSCCFDFGASSHPFHFEKMIFPLVFTIYFL